MLILFLITSCSTWYLSHSMWLTLLAYTHNSHFFPTDYGPLCMPFPLAFCLYLYCPFSSKLFLLSAIHLFTKLCIYKLLCLKPKQKFKNLFIRFWEFNISVKYDREEKEYIRAIFINILIMRHKNCICKQALLFSHNS